MIPYTLNDGWVFYPYIFDTHLQWRNNMKHKRLEHWLTTPNRSALLEPQDDIRFGVLKNDGMPTICADPSQTYQTWDGGGFTLTGASAHLTNRLLLRKLHPLLWELFSSSGIGISFLRVSLGASDLSTVLFTHDDMPLGREDFDLAYFDIGAGDNPEVISVLRAIMKINPNIKILASPWSAPAWMKTNGSLTGGKLRPECYSVYARYFVKYIQAMKQEGITVHAVTIQNEPENGANEPSMLMEADEQADFIKNDLVPALRHSHISTAIFCYDHNCDHPEYSLSILGDKFARPFVAGSAWHLYGGKIDVLSEVHEAHPDKDIYFTEQWTGRNGDFGRDLGWHAKNVLIGAIRNWAKAVLEWNLAGDKDHALHTPHGHGWESLGALTIDGQTVTRNVSYYLIGHLSKFVPPGSVRIGSNMVDVLPNVAFLRPDGKTVLLVWNGGKFYQDFNIACEDGFAQVGLEPGALATYVW